MITKVRPALSFNEAFRFLANLSNKETGYIRSSTRDISLEIRRQKGRFKVINPTKSNYEVLCLDGVYRFKYNGKFPSSLWNFFWEEPTPIKDLKTAVA